MTQTSMPNVNPPIDNPQATKDVFITNLNRAIGDQLDSVLNEMDFSSLKMSAGKSPASMALLAMVTVMQYVEELPDSQAAEATGMRMDWKYALHLPVHFPGLEAEVLEEFRNQLKGNPKGRQVFQLLLDRLAQAGLLGCRGLQKARTADVLAAVGALSRLAALIEATSLAIEALAANQTEWLRANALPHWYRRYTKETRVYPLPQLEKKQEALANEIGADIFHLLAAIDQACRPEIAGLPEVRRLRQVWRQQFEPGETLPRWRPRTDSPADVSG
jgi:transposase